MQKAMKVLTVSREHPEGEKTSPQWSRKLPFTGSQASSTAVARIKSGCLLRNPHSPPIDWIIGRDTTCCLKQVPLWAFIVTLRHIASNYENTGKRKKTTEAQTTSLNTVFKLILQLVVSGTQKNTVKNNELLFSALPERCSLWPRF